MSNEVLSLPLTADQFVAICEEAGKATKHIAKEARGATPEYTSAVVTETLHRFDVATGRPHKVVTEEQIKDWAEHLADRFVLFSLFGPSAIYSALHDIVAEYTGIPSEELVVFLDEDQQDEEEEAA